MKMKEREWAKKIAERLDKEIQGCRVEPEKKLIYASEILDHDEDGPLYNEPATYTTDILIYEELGGTKWKPRVVVETKLGDEEGRGIRTHDAITYSQKSASHKNVYPYLRYGIFIGNRKHYPLPGRLFRHGVNFDFMLSWKGYDPRGKEWKTLVDILHKEIEASEKLEEMIFESRNQQRKKYFALHKPLLTKLIAE